MKNKLNSMGYSCLTADIGGTNVRFGLVRGDHEDASHPRVTQQMIYPCSSFDSIDAAMEAYREDIGGPLPELVCMAVAGPVNKDRVRMTNRDWLISGSELRNHFGFEKVVILNDAAAIAYATTVINTAELKNIKPGRPVADAPSAIICAGTGLGVAALVPFGDQWYPLASEAGHTSLAPQTAIEVAIFDQIKTESDPISAELLLSGEGIRRLYLALASLAGVAVDALSPEIITQRALNGEDLICSEALEIYCNLLGAFAGDIALSFGARGGVYLAGNVLGHMEPMLSNSECFQRRFAEKSAMIQLLSNIPVDLITVDEPGLVGAYAWLEHSVTGRSAVPQ